MLGVLERVDDFMRERDTIHYVFPLHIARLLTRYDGRQDWLEAIRNNLCDYFINDIAKGDWSELLRVRGSFFLGNESDEGRI